MMRFDREDKFGVQRSIAVPARDPEAPEARKKLEMGPSPHLFAAGRIAKLATRNRINHAATETNSPYADGFPGTAGPKRIVVIGGWPDC